MGPSRAHGPSAGPPEANGLPEAHGPRKVHAPRGQYTPCPPLGGSAKSYNETSDLMTLTSNLNESKIKE